MEDPNTDMEDADSPASLLRQLRDSPVTASLGPAGPLLRQLRELTTTPEGVSKDELQNLTKDLEGLCISLLDHSEAKEPLSSMAKSWMSEVRELCYDTKNYLDDAPFISKQDDSGDDDDDDDDAEEKQEISKLKFKALKDRASHAKDYRIDKPSNRKPKLASTRPRLPVLHPELIDRGQMDKLAALLRKDEEKQLKVVSVVGLEGVGKTTLVKRIYHQLLVQRGGQFECGAFVRVSPNPDMRRLLTTILKQIQLPYSVSEGVSQPAYWLDAQALITRINDYLRDKRYFIIIDDLWSTSVWDVIRRAFPDDGCHSRIITTTQFKNVASACCSYQSKYIFEMQPLEDDQSRKLFSSMVFGSEDDDRIPEGIRKVTTEIIEKCNGLPLSIINIASLLLTEESEINSKQCMDVRNSLPCTLRRNPTSEGIKEILNLIYNNLSPELKTCLLYLVVHPEGYTVNKGDLVKQWVIEGFIGEGQNKEEIAGWYFDELVSRGMIQAVDINCHGVLSCTLHHTVHNLIVNKSMEENFIISVDYFQSAMGLLDKVRRLSVQLAASRSARIPVGIMMSEVQSLAFFGFYGCVDFIEECKLLRVLILHVWADQDKVPFDLSGIISKLLPLRYVKIACNITVKLPAKIQNLQFLETLEVDTPVVSIPSDIGGLSRLSCLKIAVTELSREDIRILQKLRALTALSLHVCTTPVKMIVFDKEGFLVLKSFKFRCHLPWLKFEEGSMPDLQNLNLCFNAREADQHGIVPIGMEHLSGLKEITARIWGSDTDVGSTFRTAISNHPSKPRIDVQLVDPIFHGDTTTGVGTIQVEDEKKQAADIRVSTSPRSKRTLNLWVSSSRVPVQVSSQPRSRQMAGRIVTVVSGVMEPLIGKLNTLMGDEYAKFTGVRKQASFLKKELSAMNAALHKLELVDELDPTVKDWVDHVREMSYDMENCIDDFMHQFRADDANSGFIEKITQFIKKFRQRLRIADRMEELKTLALEANDRHEKYKIDDWKPASGHVAVDLRLRAVYQEADTLVGIDGPREELVTWLMDTQKQLKVVLIVGFGGLGKTTLAKQVYDKIDSQFDCKAFFSVSGRSDMSELLNNLQYKLGMNDPVSARARKVDDIIKELREHLKKKRYLIVVDDVWDESTWNIIKCAFPEEGNGSRVIITTRVEYVAGLACQNDCEGIYRLEPLSEENSRMLLLNRVFGSEHGCPPQFEQVVAEILKKCHGFPLAVITIASILASEERSRKGWESIRDSLGDLSATNHTMEGMRSILNLSYMHLPAHLRACFLYLGMYAEDYEIVRDDLVRQWMAEGLVSNLHGQDLEAVGRNYFNELINRSMIQPSETECGEVLSCRVHDIMLELILSKCDRNNFLSVAYSYEGMARLHGCKYKVRRLSLSSMAGGEATYGPTIAVNLSQVRSFTVLGNPMPPLVLFKYLRVLRIHQRRARFLDLTAISQLFQLRYLYVQGPDSVQLPAELQGLVYLETLHIVSELKSIPSDIVLLSRLSYLYIEDCNHGLLPEWIGNMKSLRSLRMPVGRGTGRRELNGMNGIIGLGELTNLTDLTIELYHLEKPELDALACSIGKLCNLKNLLFYGCGTEIHSQMGSFSNPFPHIEHIRISVLNFHRVPIWMGGLHCLRILELCVEETSTEEVRLLGELPSLVQLRFSPSHIPKERAILGTGLFPVLEYFEFWTEEDAMAYLGFEAGAMPNLQTLVLNTKEWGGSIPVGMEHLLCLQKIHLCGVGSGDATMVSAFRDVLSLHPNHPSVEWSQTAWS